MPVIGERPEITFEKILVATDFSPVSEIAVQYAAALARRYSTPLELLNVIDLSFVASSTGTLIGPAIDVVKENARTQLESAAATITGIKVELKLLEEFSPASGILEVLEPGALLVMGTTSKHGLEKLDLGSVAEHVLRSACCPVLTVGPKVPRLSSHSVRFETIILGTDFSPQSAKAAPVALAFAEDGKSDLYLCHAIAPDAPEDELASGTSFLFLLEQSVPKSSYDWCNPHCVVEHGKVAQTLLDLAETVHADLIVLGARKSSFWLNYVHTGLTPALLAEAECPVLTVC